MKITRRQLRQIIKEELTRLDEWDDDGPDWPIQYDDDGQETDTTPSDWGQHGPGPLTGLLGAKYDLEDLGVPSAWSMQVAHILFDPNDDYKLTMSRSPSPNDSARMKSEIKLMSGRPGWGAEGAAGEIIDAIALMYSNPEEYFANQDQE